MLILIKLLYKYIIRWIRSKLYEKQIKLTEMVYDFMDGNFERLSGKHVFPIPRNH